MNNPFEALTAQPSKEFSRGRARAVSTHLLAICPAGALVGNSRTPLFVWFGAHKAAATQVGPGVLRCTVPPAQSPGRVTLRIAPETAEGAAPVAGEDQDTLSFEYRPPVWQDSANKE